MDRQWLPPIHPNNSQSSPSQSSYQGLHDQFSRLSLGPDSSPQFPNLPDWELEKIRPFRNNEIIPDFSGSSPYATCQNRIINNNNNIPGLGLGSGSSFDYHHHNNAMLPRNEYGSMMGVSENLELRLRRLDEIQFYNNLINNIRNNHHRYNNNHVINDDNYYNILTALLNVKHSTDNATRSQQHRYSVNHSRRAATTGDRNRCYIGSSGPSATPAIPTWDEVKGKVVDYANEKNLSMLLIKKFVAGQMEGLNMVVSEVKEGITQVLFNSSGSHFFQKLLPFLGRKEIFQLVKAVMTNQEDFLDICLDSHGTRAAQELVKHMDRNSGEEKAILSNALRGVILTLTKNANGYHLVQEIMKKFDGSSEVTRPILSEVAHHCIDIALDRSGCCALQFFIRHGQDSERDHIIHEVIDHSVELTENDYGNYVVQFLFGMKDDPHIKTQVIRKLEGNFVYLSKNKFGSHVVEKCLREGDDEHVNLIVREIFDENDPNIFLEILQHPTGNFVAQTALHRLKEMHLRQGSKWSLYQRLVERIESNYAFLHSHMHGKRVLSYVKCNKFRALS